MTPQEIIALIQAAITVLGLATKWGNDLKQSGELTPEQEQALDEAIAKIGTKPEDIDTGK